MLILRIADPVWLNAFSLIAICVFGKQVDCNSVILNIAELVGKMLVIQTGIVIELLAKYRVIMHVMLISTCFVISTKMHACPAYVVEVGRYIENIVDISPISIYWNRYLIGTLDIGFFDISISYQ